jgi:hypothetical protein
MYSILSNFNKILRVLREILGTDTTLFNRQIKPGPKTKFSDIEVIALACTAECMGYNSENHFFSLLNKNDFPSLLSRRQFNDRRTRLKDHVEKVRNAIIAKITTHKEAYVIDSMPLKLCRYSRRNRNKIGLNDTVKPNIGYCAAQEEHYFGYKLHAVCSFEGAVKFFDVTPASFADVNYLDTVSKKLSNCHLIADKGYISQTWKEILKEEAKVHLFTDSRSNAKKLTMIPVAYKGKRKKIETIFSQLTDQFSIQKNYAKTSCGYFARLWSKMLSMTILNYVNQHITKKPLSQLKYALSY